MDFNFCTFIFLSTDDDTDIILMCVCFIPIILLLDSMMGFIMFQTSPMMV